MKNRTLHWTFNLLLQLTVYAHTFNVFFLSDDFELLFSADNWTDPVQGFFRPLTILLIKTVYLIFGATPLPFHILSFLLHFMVGILLYLLVDTITQNRYTALIAQTLFGVYYLHSEAVLWISSINSLLVTFFCLFCILMYIKYRFTEKKKFLYLSLTALCLGLLSKESAATIPLFIILADIGITYYKKETFKWKDTLKRTLPVHLAGLGYIILKAYSISTAFGQSTLQFNYHTLRNFRHLILSLFTFDIFNDLPLLHIDIAVLNLFRDTPIPSPLLQKTDALHFYLPLATGLLITALILYLLIKGEIRTRLALLAVLVSGGPVILFSGWHLPYGGYYLYPLRHYYLPAAFFFIFLACVFSQLLDWGQKKPAFKKYVVTIVILFSVSIGISDFVKSMHRGSEWQQAGNLAHSLLMQMEPYLQQPPLEKTIVLYNLPDNHKGVCIYRNGFQSAVGIFFPQSKAVIEVQKNKPIPTTPLPDHENKAVIVLECSEGKIKPAIYASGGQNPL